MNLIRILFLSLLLSGCALFVANYDSNEYALVNKIRTLAERQDCSKKNINEIKELSIEFKNFTEFQPDNEITFNMAGNLNILVNELASKKSVSIYYCESKMSIIANSAKTIQSAIGNKPR